MLCSVAVFGQEVKRETVGSSGKSSAAGTLFVLQSVGQPYMASVRMTGTTEVREGFIQPLSMEAVKVASNIPVKVEVFPNPTTSSVQFQSEIDLGKVQLRVYDVTGVLKYSEYISNFKSYSLQCAHWASGTYILQLEDEQHKVHTTKLMISK